MRNAKCIINPAEIRRTCMTFGFACCIRKLSNTIFWSQKSSDDYKKRSLANKEIRKSIEIYYEAKYCNSKINEPIEMPKHFDADANLRHLFFDPLGKGSREILFVLVPLVLTLSLGFPQATPGLEMGSPRRCHRIWRELFRSSVTIDKVAQVLRPEDCIWQLPYTIDLRFRWSWMMLNLGYTYIRNIEGSRSKGGFMKDRRKDCLHSLYRVIRNKRNCKDDFLARVSFHWWFNLMKCSNLPIEQIWHNMKWYNIIYSLSHRSIWILRLSQLSDSMWRDQKPQTILNMLVQVKLKSIFLSDF
jgi:hypothetical protein